MLKIWFHPRYKGLRTTYCAHDWCITFCQWVPTLIFLVDPERCCVWQLNAKINLPTKNNKGMTIIDKWKHFKDGSHIFHLHKKTSWPFCKSRNKCVTRIFWQLILIYIYHACSSSLVWHRQLGGLCVLLLWMSSKTSLYHIVKIMFLVLSLLQLSTKSHILLES